MNVKARVISFGLFICIALSINATEIYISPNGSDNNPGTKEKPMATLAMALRKVRDARRVDFNAFKGGVKIIVLPGTYTLHEPIFVRPEDSGEHDSPITIEGAPGSERPIFSGGVSVTGWRKPKRKIAGLPESAQKQVWVTDAPEVGGRLLEFRQLWINEQKAIRARDRNGDSMNRILNWNHQTEKCIIPLSETPALDNATTMEMVIHQWWAIAILRIKSIDIRGDSAGLTFHQPESRIQSEHPWPAPWLSKKTGNSAFYLTNAIQLLDQPGEWFLDMKNRQVIYWPRQGEDMRSANVVAPALETLLKIQGTVDRPVRDIAFRGIDFRYTTWLRPSQAGHVPLQAGMYLLDAYKLKIPGTYDKAGLENQAWIGRQPAAVELKYVSGTWFDKCRFSHMAATGVDFVRGSMDDAITGCLFYDIGGTAIQAGTFSDEGFETHLPFNPSDERELCRNLRIKNNLITQCTNEDWGCVGISGGYVQGINIEHNELSELSYSGICVGWGWTKTISAARNNRIHANYVHHYAKRMYDVGGIYTLGAQPGSIIFENRVESIYTAPYAHDPTHWFYMYLDEGSSYITIKDNWLEKDKIMKNANGPGNVWENNGPMVDEKIKNAAGLEPAYRNLLKK